MALFQVLYMSSLVASDAEPLAGILEASVRNNKRKNITGMLLYADGNILQVIEGEKNVLLETFSAIQQDSRHRDIFVLIEEEIATRQFASWSMGFKHLTAADLEKLPMATQIFKTRPDEIEVRVRPSNALAVLQSFAQGSMPIV